jgi:hypothetical protein
MSEMNPDQIAIVNHTDWLNHPVTLQMFANIEKMKNKYIAEATLNSGNHDVPDNNFRLMAYALKTIDAVVMQTKSTSKFVELGKLK